MQIKHHLAIPTKDVNESMKFYSSLGCKIGRFNDKMCIVDFFGCQLVCHLDPGACAANPKMYPRHFGIIFDNSHDWYVIKDYCNKMNYEFFQNEMTRNSGTPQEHLTFFLKDPSNNLIEFKYYKDKRVI